MGQAADNTSKSATASLSTAALSRSNLLAASVTIALIVGSSFLIFRPVMEAFKVLLGGTLASLLTVLLIYILRKTLLRPVDDYEAAILVESVAGRITETLSASLTASPGVTCFSRWNDIQWKSLLANVHTLEFFVSYMDTWVNLTHDPLLEIFQRGGKISVYLPVPDNERARRIGERFPEYNPALIKDKITNTERKLHAIYEEAANKSALLEVGYTKVFIMHCLMRLDEKRVLLSPFDHFRRGRIEGPAWLVEVDQYPHIGRWADKEFQGFKENSVLSRPDNYRA